ncbi:unnamed protein product [Dibothriocephalus latus]|uniref:Reverse transcriptase domain-containing protein n=1 Tax=Dibothriocephalus latus TaxID=60516 RepID=A0A3P7PBW2_DIBLA|nr:unnamed protein product [Dibothriocephalus latus]
MKSAHSTLYFAERQRLVPSRTTWTTQEDRLLRKFAIAIIQKEGQLALRPLARGVKKHFPTRSAEALCKRLSKLNNKVLIYGTLGFETAVNPPLVVSSSPPPMTEADQSQACRLSLLHSAAHLLAESRNEALCTETLLSLVTDLLMDDAQWTEAAATRLDSHALHVFPPKWKPEVHTDPQRDEVQAQLEKNYKAGAQLILSGDWRQVPFPEAPLPPGTLEFWRELTERPSGQDQRPVIPPAAVAWSLLDPLEPSEVTQHLRLMVRSAAGMDGHSAKDLLRWPPTAIAGYLNLILATGYLPLQHCTCRTTLVPNVRLPTLPSQFHPTAVSNAIPCLLNRILASRWSRFCPTSRFQFGFQKRDGTAEATVLLHGILRQAVTAPKSLAVAVLEMDKAFDSVNHSTLLRAAAAHGAPPSLIHLLSSSYSRSSTFILDAEVRCFRGVRQDDSLSPLLFSGALSEALSYSDRQLGFEIGETTVDCLAYADDLVLFAESPDRLQVRLDGLVEGLSLAGMQLNPSRCTTFFLQALGKDKSSCLRLCNVLLGGTVLPSLGPQDTFKYLGVPFSYRGKQPIRHRPVLHDMMAEVSEAPINHQQRFSLLKRSCVPKLLHELVLGTVHRNTLENLDMQIRQTVRSALKLPTDTPTSFLYAKIRDGGLGVPCLKTLVPLAKRRRLDNVLRSKEPVVRAVAVIPSALSSMRLAAEPVRMGCKVLASKKDARTYWRDSLYNSADGHALAHFANSTCANHWLSSPDRVLPWLFIRGIQLRAGVLSTKARGNRRTGSGDVLCRGQCGQRETLIHILQCCRVTQTARLGRHNNVMNLLRERLAKIHPSVLLEPRIPEGSKFCKPDIILLNESSATVIDVAVAGEDCMEKRYTGKIERYSAAEIEANIRQTFAKPSDFPITHMPAVFSARGTVYARTERGLRTLGLSKFDISDLALEAIRGSVTAYDIFTRGAGGGRIS